MGELGQQLRDVAYLVAAVLFILDLKWMAYPRKALRGNWAGVAGMALAIGATLLGERLEWNWIVGGALIGTAIGWIAAVRVEMTAMPEMVGLFNGFGGAASVLVSGGALIAAQGALAAGGAPADLQTRIATVAGGLIGSITFFGSWVAFGKLAEFLAVKWKLRTGQKLLKYGFPALVVAGAAVYAFEIAVGSDTAASDRLPIALGIVLAALAMGGILLIRSDRFPGIAAAKWVATLASLALCVAVVLDPGNDPLFWLLVAVSGVLGVLLTISIGGADMPVAIALLNSYSGLAGAATGFVIDNSVLIVSGSLVGASGVILTQIMCKAMNRSLANVLFGSLGPSSSTPDAEEVYRTVKSTSAEDVALLLDGARRVVVVPGYGMAVSQAQHAVHQLAQALEARGTIVEFAVHPVAGRMPGHMNILLAEANVPYEKLREMNEINPEMEQVDVAIVIGANDVVNPVAETDPTSPIAGMPIIQAHKAHTVIVVKRSLAPGFAGIPNPLFAAENSLMLYADAKKAIQDILQAVKENA